MRGRRLLVDVAPLRESRQFRRLWFGYLVGTLGAQVTLVAVPYQIFKLTRSSLDVGLLGLATIAPVLLGALVGGSVADAVDRRRVLLVSQVLLGCCSLGLFLNALSPSPALWPLYVCAAGAAGFASADVATRAAVFANLVERRQYSSANALWQLLVQVGAVVGPALAGLLLGQVGVASAYGFDCCTFAVSIAAVLVLAPLRPAGGGTPFGLRSIREGLSYLKGHQVLLGTFLVDLNAMILGMPRALFPAIGLVTFHGGGETVGLLYAAPGVGALVGSAFTGWVHGIRRQGRAVLVAVTVWGAAIAAFGVVPWFGASLALLAVAGAADVISAVFRGTILQTEAPDALRGRLSSINTAVVSGGPRLGDVEAGGLAALVGVETSVVVGGLGCLAGVGLIRWLMPRFAGYANPEVRGQSAAPLEPA